MSHDGERNDGVHEEQHLNSSSTSNVGSIESNAARRIAVIAIIDSRASVFVRRERMTG